MTSATTKELDVREMVNIAEAYDMTTEFPTTWNESRQDVENGTMGTTSKNVLINQLITDLKSSEHTSTVDEVDPLGTGSRILEIMRIKGKDVDALGEDRGTYLPSSTKFNALKFLTEVHGDSSGEQLERSLGYLKGSISQKSKQQINVDEDYQQFVTAKEQLDQVFNMISGKTSEGVQVDGLGDQIDEAMRSYTLVMRPLEESGAIRDRLHTAHNLVKNYQYALTLPATLQHHIQNAEHDEFIRDWNTGRGYLAEFSQSSKSPDCQKISQVIETAVNSIVDQYRTSLWKQLMQMQVDKPYTRTLEMLADLEITKNPLYGWMSHQVDQIQSNLNDFMELELQNLSNLCRYDRVRGIETNVVLYIKKLALGSSDLDTYDTIEHWMLLQQVFGAFNEHVVKIMAFWKECNLIVSGRKAVGQLSLDPAQEKEIRQKFVIIVDEISRALLSMVDGRPQTPNENSSSSMGVAYIPMNANTLSTAKYLNQILSILLESEAEINQPAFSKTIAHVRSSFVRSVCDCWLKDSKTLGQLQNFRRKDASKCLESVTDYFSTFHKWVITEVHKLEPQGGKQLDAILMALLTASMESYKQYLVGSSGTRGDQWGLSLAPTTKDIQLLITINNLDHIKRTSVPGIYDLYTGLFGGTSRASVQLEALVETSNELILDLFSIFSTAKRSQISKIISDGMKASSTKWNQNQDPVRISQHIYEALMLLVDIEADFSVYAPNFIGPIFSNLYNHFLESLVRGVREFDQLGQLGTLQLVADTEFTTEIMSTIHGNEAKKILADLNESIRSISGQSLYADREALSSRVSTLVERALDADKTAFICFKSVSINYP